VRQGPGWRVRVRVEPGSGGVAAACMYVKCDTSLTQFGGRGVGRGVARGRRWGVRCECVRVADGDRARAAVVLRR
jgi:hypothetical protein